MLQTCRQSKSVSALLLPAAHRGEMTVINHGHSQLYESLLLSESVEPLLRHLHIKCSETIVFTKKKKKKSSVSITGCPYDN